MSRLSRDEHFMTFAISGIERTVFGKFYTDQKVDDFSKACDITLVDSSHGKHQATQSSEVN